MSIQDLPQALIDTAAKIVSEGSKYHDFFAKAMKKFGITSPSELKGDKEKEFYDYIDKNWKGKGEKKEERIIRVMSEVGGKYLKYSDLLLQKSRLISDGQKPDSPSVQKVDKLLAKEMKKLGIEEESVLNYFDLYKEEVITEKAMSLKQIAKKYKKDIAKLNGQMPKYRSKLELALLAHAYDKNLIKTDNPDHADQVLDGLLDDLASLT